MDSTDETQSLRDRNAQLEHDAIMRAALVVEREKSEAAYAIKLVERVVFGAVGLVAVAVLGAIIALVLK